jgi:hypothetical protein
MKKVLFGIFVIGLALLMLHFVSPVLVRAQTGTSPPDLPFEWIHALWSAAQASPIALIIAFASSLAGYLSCTPPESFSLGKFLYTALISGLIGFLTLIAGWNYSAIQQWLANGFLTWYIWKVSNIIANLITKKFGPASLATASPSSPKS